MLYVLFCFVFELIIFPPKILPHLQLLHCLGVRTLPFNNNPVELFVWWNLSLPVWTNFPLHPDLMYICHLGSSFNTTLEIPYSFLLLLSPVPPVCSWSISFWQNAFSCASQQKEIGKRGSKGHPSKCTLELNFPFSSYSLHSLVLIFCHLRNYYTCHHPTHQNFWCSRSEVGSGSLQFDAHGLEATLREPTPLKKYAWDLGCIRPHLFHQSGHNASFGHCFSQKVYMGYDFVEKYGEEDGSKWKIKDIFNCK